MWWISVGYTVTVVGLCLSQYHSERVVGSISTLHGWLRACLYGSPLLLARATFKTRVFMYIFCATSFVVYYYIFPTSQVVQVQLDLLLSAGYDIFRYGVYYDALVHRMQSITDAKREFPYHGIVSNCANVFQLRLYTLARVVPEVYLLYASAGCIAAGGIVCSSFWEDVQSHQLFNKDVKLRRLHVQSSIVFCATLCRLATSRLVDGYIQSTTYVYDFIPLVVSLVLISVSKNVFLLHYRTYSLICPLASLCSTVAIIVLNDTMPIYVSNSLYAIFQTMYFILFDPTRLILYVSHYNEAASMYVAYDILLMGLAHAANDALSGQAISWVVVPVHVAWVLLAIYSKKYYLKDVDRLECIRMLESG